MAPNTKSTSVIVKQDNVAVNTGSFTTETGFSATAAAVAPTNMVTFIQIQYNAL